MSQALEEKPEAYENFNDFFVRELKPGLRPVPSSTESIACPADGVVSQLGDIENGLLIQAKGRGYDVNTLLGGDEFISQHFNGGRFATIYLSPKDYHRVHMPFDGQLEAMVHIPGDLFSVNKATTELVPNLFARNERMVAIFDTSAGPMAVVMVGAMVVASIETSWHGLVTPVKREVRTINYPNTTEDVKLNKGDEVGKFKLGSTAIVLFGPDMVEWDREVNASSNVKMGQKIGELING